MPGANYVPRQFGIFPCLIVLTILLVCWGDYHYYHDAAGSDRHCQEGEHKWSYGIFPLYLWGFPL